MNRVESIRRAVQDDLACQRADGAGILGSLLDSSTDPVRQEETLLLQFFWDRHERKNRQLTLYFGREGLRLEPTEKQTAPYLCLPLTGLSGIKRDFQDSGLLKLFQCPEE